MGESCIRPASLGEHKVRPYSLLSFDCDLVLVATNLSVIVGAHPREPLIPGGHLDPVLQKTLLEAACC